MKVGIATDHNGVNEKQELIRHITNLDYEVMDLSPNNTPTDDYPDFAKIVSMSVLNKTIDQGIIMCGTGIGMSIAANKFKGIRCAKVSNIEEASLAREHNDANILALSYRLPMNELKKIIEVYLSTSYTQDERHIRRINKIKEIEDANV